MVLYVHVVIERFLLQLLLSTEEVFQHLVTKAMQKECAVVRSARELLAYKPWAYYFVVPGRSRKDGSKLVMAQIRG